MEITSTIVTQTATQKTDSAVYQVEYIEQDGRFSRIHCNIHSLNSETGDSGEYVGSVYLENDNFSCSLVYNEETVLHLTTIIDLIQSIRAEGSTGAETKETETKK